MEKKIFYIVDFSKLKEAFNKKEESRNEYGTIL